MDDKILSYVITKTNSDKIVDVYIHKIKDINEIPDINDETDFFHYSVDLSGNTVDEKDNIKKKDIKENTENIMSTASNQSFFKKPVPKPVQGGRKRKTQKRKRGGLKTIKFRK